MIRSTIFCIWKGLFCSLFFILVFSFLSFSQNPIVTENALPGNPYSEWGVPDFRDNRIAGFATKMSLNRGETVRFKINVQSGTTYTLKIYRIGYYGGDGSRLIANLGTLTGTVQPNGISNSSTGHLDCSNWSESASWAIPSSAVSGFYIAKLERTGGGSNHIAFIVRNDASNSDLYVQFPDATWQAYNGYGGNSMYDGNTSWPAGHAVKVSYNRPFFPYNSLFNTDGREADWYMNAEYPMIRWLERNGYDATYTSCNDVTNNGNRLFNHQVFVTLGHDEYWSKEHRENVEAARNAGVHIAFFAGNEVYWKTRWENNNGTEDRTLVCYKEGFLGDGTLGERTCGYKCDPSSEWTGLWRTGGGYDAGQPENSLGGQISWVEYPAEIGVPAYYKNLRFWRNTSVANLSSGQTAFLGVNTLGYEWDYEQPQYASSNPTGRITMSSRTVNGLTHKLSLYRHSSGALVFGAGTVQWSWGLDGEHWGGTTTVSPEMQQATVNLFADMGVQPGTLQAGLTAASQSSDFTAPTATITSPSNGASFSSGANITFSGNANDGGGGVVASVEVSVDGGATWTPATVTSIASSTSWIYTWSAGPDGTYNIQTRGIDDSGNKGNPGSGIIITVGVGGGDFVPPTVSTVSPANGAAGVSVNSTVIANFSEAISGASVTGSTYQLRAGSNLVSGSVNTSGNQITLTPSAALSPSTTYTVTITGGSSGVRDLAGNALVNTYSWTFTTGGGGGGGSVTLFLPTSVPDDPLANDGQGIALGMRFRTTQNGFITGIRYYKGAGTTGTHTGHLWTNTGTQLAQATFANETASGWQQVLFSSPVAVTAGVTYVASYFSPSGDYCATKPYFTQAVVNGPLRGLADGEDGPNGLYRYTGTSAFPNSSFQSSNYWVDVVFNTSSGSDATPPTVTSVSPQNGATGVSISTTVIANFSEAVNSATITGATFQLRDPGNNLISASLNTSGSQITLTPSAVLNGSTLYTATIVGGSTGVKDLAGNALASNFTWSFTTASVDNTPPTVTSVSPVNGATGVSVTANVVANFSEAINSSTVTGTTFQLRDAGNNLVSAAVSTSGNQITLNPSASLAASTTYTATITGGASGVKDLAGNALANNFSWSFTTAIVDNTPPTVTSVFPVNGATGISSNTTVVANFSESINASTVTGSTFQLRDAGNNLIAASVSTSGTQISLTPSSPLAASVTYTATITGGASGVKDLAGNALASNYSWSFTMASGGGGGTTFTVFQVTHSPEEPANNDGQGIVLGMKFRSSQNGFITGVRYYKGGGATGTHTGHLWSSTGTLLGSTTFTGETASGWQQTLFTTPIAINANITYVVSLFSPSGDYAASDPYFTQAVINGPLRALADGEDGPNGLYTYSSTSVFPNSSFNASNYWVDVVFTTSGGGGTAPNITLHPSSQSRCAGSSATFTSAAGGTPTPTVQWQVSTNGTTWTNISGATVATLTFTTSTLDNNKQYRAVWTNSTSSVNSGSATLTVNAIPSAPVISVVNNCGSSTLTANSFTGSLLWSTGATTPSITVTAAGTYTATQTLSGCTSSPGSGVAAPLNANVSAPTVTVVNNCGSSTLTAGSFTGSLLWSTAATSASITVTAAGTYTVTQTVNGCTSTPGSGVAAPLNSNVSAPTVTVVNNCGSSTLTAGSFTGSLLWSTGATTASITVTAAGTYTVRQTVNGCTSSPGSGVAAPLNSNVPAPTVSVINSCGSSTLTAGSFTGSLLWNTGATTASITVTAAGTYTVRQTVNGCTSSPGSGVAAPISSNVTAPTVSVTNNCNSSVLTAGSFTGSLLWSTGATTPSITVTAPGIYTVTQTVSGCTSPAAGGTAAPKPTPALSSNLTGTATSGSPFTYTPTSTVVGTTFTWTRAAVTGISNAAGSGTGGISETLTNTTTSPVNVTYVYTLTASGCTNTQNLVVTVNPATTVNCTINGTSLVASFNSTSIPAGRYIWFNSSFDPGSLGTGTTTVTMNITNTVITFTASGQPYVLNVPDARIRFDATASSASTQFVNGKWETVVPRSFTSYVFMNGLSYQVPVNFPGSISNVRWTTNVSIDRTNTSINWRWSAAVYTTFAGHSGINVKPISGSSQNPYPNSDRAGTPENFKSSLVSGARGGGGSNYTGSFVNSGSITCSTSGTRSAPEPLITRQTIADRLQDFASDRLAEEGDLDARVMPNPSSTFFNLAIKGNNESPVSIKILDIFGRVVERHDRIAANTVLKVGSKWTNGSYFAEVVQGNQRKIIKIIKAR